MKVITLWQPWASLIGRGKAHETRSWPTAYRGPLLIHAAKTWNNDLARLSYREPYFGVLATAGFRFLPQLTQANALLPLGAVVALADLVQVSATECIEPASNLDRAFGDWSSGRWAWELADVRILPEPIPWPGAQGLRDAPPELVGRVLHVLETHEVLSK